MIYNRADNNRQSNRKLASEILKKGSPLRFLVIFISLFLVFYYGNIAFFSLTSNGRHYNAFIDEHLNYIRGLRHLLLQVSKTILNCFGFNSISDNYQLLVAGHGFINIIYSCLGLGVMSFFAAFVIAYPRRMKPKLIFLLVGLACIQVLNVLRFVLLVLFWDKKSTVILDHHTIFNIAVYVIIAISLYFWVKHDDRPQTNAKS